MKVPAHDLTPVLDRLDALAAQVERITERQRAHDELMEEMTPIAREAMASAIAKLDALERGGYLAFAAEAAGVARRVADGFSADDVRRLGDSIVGLLETLRAVTQPDVLDARPLGLLGVARAARKDDHVRKGLAVLIEVVRRIGQRAERDAPRAPTTDRKAHLAAMLGPRRARLQLPSTTTATMTTARTTTTTAATAMRAPAPPAAAPPAAPAASATADPAWTRAKGEQVASAQGLALTDAHWAVVDAARADFAAVHASPNIRRLTQVAGVTTKDLYALFPRAPGRTIAAIAGLPKPAGCL